MSKSEDSIELQRIEREELIKKRKQEQKNLPNPSNIEIEGYYGNENSVSSEEYKKIEDSKIYVGNLSKWWDLAKKTGQKYYDEIFFSSSGISSGRFLGYLILVDSATAYYWEIIQIESNFKMKVIKIKICCIGYVFLISCIRYSFLQIVVYEL